MKTKRLDWRILSFLKCWEPEVNKLSCVSFAEDSLQILRGPVCVLVSFEPSSEVLTLLAFSFDSLWESFSRS